MGALKTLEGDFALSDRIEVSRIRKSEKLDGLTGTGNQRLRELQMQGYLCRTLTSLRWSCEKDFEPLALPAGFAETIRAKWGGFLISLRTTIGQPSLVVEDEGVRIWTAIQKVYVRTSQNAVPKTWESVSYVNTYTPTASTWAIYLGDYRDQSSPSLLVVDEKTMSVQDSIEDVLGNASTKYFVRIYISRIQ